MLPAALKGCVKMGQVNINFWILNRMLPGKISHRDESGFTMLEIVASVAILVIAIIPMLGLFTGAPALHAQQEQQTRAAFLAQLRLEEVKSKAARDFDADYNKTSVSAADFPAPDTKFRYTVSHSTADADIKEFSVTVWYDENDNNSLDSNELQFLLMTKFTSGDFSTSHLYLPGS